MTLLDDLNPRRGEICGDNLDMLSDSIRRPFEPVYGDNLEFGGGIRIPDIRIEPIKPIDICPIFKPEPFIPFEPAPLFNPDPSPIFNTNLIENSPILDCGPSPNFEPFYNSTDLGPGYGPYDISGCSPFDPLHPFDDPGMF